jgi:flagellum-specific ATP synthase
MDEPIADTVRGVLDGHIVLSRKLAQRSHYPAIDVLQSISRLTGSVTGPETQKVLGRLRKSLAVYQESEAMINVGAYVKGSNPELETAIAQRDSLEEFLTQGVSEPAPIHDSLNRMAEIAGLPIPEEEIDVYLDKDAMAQAERGRKAE